MFQQSSNRPSLFRRLRIHIIIIFMLMAPLLEIEGLKCYECDDTKVPRYGNGGMTDSTGKQTPGFRCQIMKRVIYYECSSIQNTCFKVVIYGAGKDELGRRRDIVKRGCHSYKFDENELNSSSPLTHWCKDEKISPPYDGLSCFCTTDFCNSSPNPPNRPNISSFIMDLGLFLHLFCICPYFHLQYCISFFD